jgi:hypothetical protein
VWLPVIVIVPLVLGVYGGVPVIYLDTVPAAVLPYDAAAVLYDTIVRFLRAGLRSVLVVALVVAAAGS